MAVAQAVIAGVAHALLPYFWRTTVSALVAGPVIVSRAFGKNCGTSRKGQERAPCHPRPAIPGKPGREWVGPHPLQGLLLPLRLCLRLRLRGLGYDLSSDEGYAGRRWKAER